MNLFQKIENKIYGIDGTLFGTTLSDCQTIDYLYRIGFQDNQQIKLNFEQYTYIHILQDQRLVKYFPSNLSTFNLVASPTFKGSIGFGANGDQIISHAGAGQFQLSNDHGAVWSNLPTVNVAGIAGNIGSSLKNNFHYNIVVGQGNLNSFAYLNGLSWVMGNMPGNNTWNAVFRGTFGSIQTVAVGFNVMANLGPGNSWYTRPISNGDWKATALLSEICIALDYNGRITKASIPWTNWSTPQQLFSIGAWNVDLDVINGTQGYRFIAVGYSLSNATAELYISNLFPDQFSFDINNLSWLKINIPNGRWFKINNKSSVSNRQTDIIYITEDPDDGTSTNKALVSWDCGESWSVVQLPTENGTKGSIMYLDKSSIGSTPYMRWFVSNGLNHAGYGYPPKLYSGVSLI